jgi:hypothetical protein
MKEPAPPRFFLDRGLGGRIVPEALRSAGWSCVTMNERYGARAGESLADVEWIADASERGEVSLCKDKQIAWNPNESMVRGCSRRTKGVSSAWC